MKKIIIFAAIIIFQIIFTDRIFAISFKIRDNIYAYQDNKSIVINDNNIKLDEIKNASLLDVNEKYILYNSDNYIKVYQLKNKAISNIDKGYNAMLHDDLLIYESDNNGFKCRNIIDDSIKNCIKLYSFDLIEKTTTYLDIPGNDIYLNDISDSYLIYNSIHITDNYCNNICSFIGTYNLVEGKHNIINKYNDISLDMSGNGYVRNNVLIFESFFDDRICISTKIMLVDLNNYITKKLTDNLCEFKNIEIVDFDGEYILFNNNENYVFHLNSNKYTEVDIDFKELYLYNNEILYLYSNELLYKKIDKEAPIINESRVYEIILGDINNLKDKLDMNDNLFSKENISLTLLSDINKEGMRNASILLCDKLNNCKEYKIMINAILKDTQAPKIYCDEIIYLKHKDKFDISDYAYAMDTIDGEMEIFINEDVSKLKKGTHTLKLKSIDKSGNISYKDVVIKIYSDDLIYMWYYLCLVILIIMVIIIYIYRFKKKIIF